MTTVPPHLAQGSATIEDITSLKGQSLGQRLLASQPFWITIALILMCAVMTWDQPDAFASADNFYNITRNFAFIGIMAVGMTAVILTGGIDLSVGSVMGLVDVVPCVVLQERYNWALAIPAGLVAGALAGAV